MTLTLAKMEKVEREVVAGLIDRGIGVSSDNESSYHDLYLSLDNEENVVSMRIYHDDRKGFIVNYSDRTTKEYRLENTKTIEKTILFIQYLL